MAGSEVIIDPTFRFEACATREMEELVVAKAMKAYSYVYKTAPKRSNPLTGTPPHPASYASNLKVEKELKGYGWESRLKAEAVNWHFLEFGFRDRAGRTHTGLHLLEKGLKMSRL